MRKKAVTFKSIAAFCLVLKMLHQKEVTNGKDRKKVHKACTKGLQYIL